MYDYFLLYQLLIIVFLIILSAFFSSSETALTSTSEALLQKMVSEGSNKALNTQKILQKKEVVISAILLGNNLVNILASALATNIFIKVFGAIGILYSTLSMTSIIFVFAEVLPKIYAIRKSDKLLIFYTPYLKFVVWFLSPINLFVYKVIKYFVKYKNNSPKSLNLDRIRGAILIADQEGGMVKDNKYMLESILDLTDREIVEVMIHRKDILSLNKKLDRKAFLQLINNSPFSRFPIWEVNTENIIGVVHVKDLLKLLSATESFDINSIIQEPLFVPETTSLLEQLNAFREKQKQMAFIVDEYGVLQGLVTLEDILEEIVGQIDDEYDPPSSTYKSDNNGNFVVSGNVTLRDINRLHHLNFPEDEASTVAGLIINISKRIPEKGETFMIRGYMFTVIARTGTRITKVNISKNK